MQLEGMSVLVVEDEPDTLELLAFILQQCGAAVTTAGSVREALDVFDRARPAVLVSDISMPESDGYQLIADVRARGADRGGSVPAVAVTAHRHEHNRRRALAAGFQEFLTKPVDPEILCDTVARIRAR